MKNIDFFYPFVFFAVIAGIIIWELVRYRFITKLRSDAPDVWHNLGEPRGLLSRLVLLEGFDVEKYIFFGKYTDLPTDELIRSGRVLHIVGYILLMVYLVAIVVLLVL